MATVIDDLLVRLGFDADTSGAREFDASLGNILGTVGKISVAMAVAGTAIAGFLGKGILDTAAQFEVFELQLETLEGSSAKAKESLDWIQDFAKVTPFNLEDVIQGFIKLKAYGFDAKDGIMEVLGDSAGALGGTLIDKIEALADAQMGDNARLQNAFNVKARDDGDYVEYYYKNIKTGNQEVARALKTDADDIKEKLLDIIKMNYGGGMEKLSKSWEGIVGNFSDSWEVFKKNIADRGIFSLLKNEVSKLANFIENNADKISDQAVVIGDKLVEVFYWVKDTLFDVWDAALWTRDAFKSLSETLGITEHGGKILAGVLALLAANMVGFAVLSMIARLQALVMVVKSLTGPIALIGAAIIILGLAIQDIYGYLNGQDSFVGQLIADHPVFEAFVNFVVNNFKLIIALIGVMAGAYVMMKAAAIAGFLLSMTTGLLSYALLAAGAIAAGLATAAAWIIAFAPFLLIAAIVAGVIAIFWQLYKNWAAIWDGIKSIASSVGDFIMGIFRSIGDAFGWVWDKVKMLMGVKVPDVDLKTTQSIEQVFGDPKAGFSQSSGYWKDSIAPSVNSKNAGYQGNTSNSTINQNINVNSANEAAMIAARTAQGSREQSNGYQ